MSDLTIFVPTRGRSTNMVDFASEFDRHCTGDTKVVFVFDEDDDHLSRYKAENADRWEYFVAPKTRRGMVGALNAAYNWYDSNGKLGDYIGFMGDDHRPRSTSWDEEYMDELLEMRTGFVYGNDLLQGELMPTQVAFTTNIARALGYMCPPELDHLCVDLVWKEWGKAIDKIVYLDDVIIEHMHPLAGKARMDKPYRVVNSVLMANHDGAAYRVYMEDGRFAEDVGRIKMMMENGYSEPR